MKVENTKKVIIEIKKGISIGLLLISIYGIWTYIYKTQNKNNIVIIEKKLEKNTDVQNEKNKKHEVIKGYEYKWTENEIPEFVKRNLGYEKKFLKTVSLEELEKGLKDEYCDAVREIEKVDQKIVPGTNISFKEATYIQVNDAYKEYLQRIAQIREIYILRTGEYRGDEIFESNIKCKYKDTKWNIDNLEYFVGDFMTNSGLSDYYDK